MAIPKPKIISRDPKHLSPVLLFGNLSQTNYYQVNFTGFGANGALSRLSNYLKRFPSEDNGVDLKFVTEGVGFLCSEATLPGSSLATAEVKDNFMGIQQEFAHTRLYSDIDFTFYVDTNYNTLKFFEGWIDFISSGSEMDIKNTDNMGGSLGSGRLNSYYYRRMMWPDDYKCNTMSITKFEKDYGKSIHYLFINAFPKLVTAVPVSYGAADILRVSVSFNYDRYVVNPPSGQFEVNKIHEFNISRKSSSELRSIDVSKSQSLDNNKQPPGPPGTPKSPKPPVPTIEPTVHATTYKYDSSRNYGLSQGGEFTFKGRDGNMYTAKMDNIYNKGEIDIVHAGLKGYFRRSIVDTNMIKEDGTGPNAWLFEDLYNATRPSTGNFGQQYGPMASDARLKENIVKVGNSPSGIGIYEWNYKSAPNSRYQGVMAQEVMQIVPEAVYSEEDGFLSVYYDMLDVDVKLVSK